MSESPTIQKSFEELAEAHDLVHALLTDQVPGEPMAGHQRENWAAALSVLCWILGHELGEVMAKNLAKVRQAIEDAGLSFEPLPPEDHIKKNGSGPLP